MMRFLVLTVFLCAATAIPAYAQPHVAGKAAKTDIVTVITETIFDEVEKAIIEDYFGIEREEDKDRNHDKKHKKDKGNKGLPPGLATRESLPPGLQKQLDENGALPPGLATRDLPDDLLGKLPDRKGTKRIIFDNDIVLIEEGTRKVLDILKDVVK